MLLDVAWAPDTQLLCNLSALQVKSLNRLHTPGHGHMPLSAGTDIADSLSVATCLQVDKVDELLGGSLTNLSLMQRQGPTTPESFCSRALTTLFLCALHCEVFVGPAPAEALPGFAP